MRQWKYCYFNYSEAPTVVLLTPEGETRDTVQGCGGILRSREQKAACTIARLGEDGWEAIWMFEDGVMWFKRLKED
jgi:hypothetical protein